MKFSPVLAASLCLLSACSLPGTPASKAQITAGLQDQTLYRNSASEGYVNRRYIYHRPGGIVTMWEQTNTPYQMSRERQRGTWQAQDGKVCYALKKGNKCTEVNIDGGRLVMAGGELRPRDIGGTQRKNGVKVWQSAAVRNAPSVSETIAATPFGDMLKAAGRLAASMPQGGAPAPSSGPGKSFQCTLDCTNSGLAAATSIVGDSLRRISVQVTAADRYAARSHATSNRSRICESADLLGFAGGRVDCR